MESYGQKNVLLTFKHFTNIIHEGTMGEQNNSEDRVLNTNNVKSIVHTNYLYSIFTLYILL